MNLTQALALVYDLANENAICEEHYPELKKEAKKQQEALDVLFTFLELLRG